MSGPVLVVGATHGTGLLAARVLRDRGVGVRALARNPAAAREALGPGIETVEGDLTRAETLPPALAGVAHVVFTAGIRSGRFATSDTVRRTDFDGVVHTLSAARAAGFSGRFVYMTSIGGVAPSFLATFLNFVKGDVLVWRRRAEDEIRRSGFDYAVVRAGFLRDAPGGTRAVVVTQEDVPLVLRHQIARADVAEACIAAATHPRASRATFAISWGRGPRRTWDEMLGDLRADAP